MKEDEGGKDGEGEMGIVRGSDVRACAGSVVCVCARSYAGAVKTI